MLYGEAVLLYIAAYYTAAHDAVRRHAAGPTVVMPVYQRRWSDFAQLDWFPPERFDRGLRSTPNVAYDLHLYQCFGQTWQARELPDILERAESGSGHWPSLSAIPADAIVSEFSLRLPEWDDAFPSAAALRALSPAERDEQYRRFALGQLRQFRRYEADCYFWTLCVDDPNEGYWDLRECFRRGWLRRGDWTDYGD